MHELQLVDNFDLPYRLINSKTFKFGGFEPKSLACVLGSEHVSPLSTQLLLATRRWGTSSGLRGRQGIPYVHALQRSLVRMRTEICVHAHEGNLVCMHRLDLLCGCTQKMTCVRMYASYILWACGQRISCALAPNGCLLCTQEISSVQVHTSSKRSPVCMHTRHLLCACQAPDLSWMHTRNLL